MKLNDIPAPVWYMGGAVLAILVVGHFIKKGAGSLVDGIEAVGNAVNPLNSDLVKNPGNTGQVGAEDPSGGWTSIFTGLFGGSSAYSAPVTTPYDYGAGTTGAPYAPSATDPGYQMTDYANLGNLKF